MSFHVNSLCCWRLALNEISTLLHRQMQSIRFILDSFGLAPAAVMNNLTTDYPITCDTAGYEKPKNLCGEQKLQTYSQNQCNATNPLGFKGFLVTKQYQQKEKKVKETDAGLEWLTT